MNRRTFLQTVACGAVAAAATRPMNFVFILMDDLGWADVGCNGSKFYETPNIDKLAARGTRFTNAYAAAPVCSPTRASIMTGKHPAHVGITNYLPGKHTFPYTKLIGTECVQNLPLAEVTIAEALAPAGYTSAHIGKWHLGATAEYWPEKQGFALNVGGSNSGMPKSFFYPQWKGNPPVDGKDGEYLTDRLTDAAVDFIEKNQAKPFFLYLPHYAVHVPIEAKQKLVEKYKAKRAQWERQALFRPTPGLYRSGHGYPQPLQNDPAYAAMIESMDQSVGHVVETLERLKLSDNTVVFFTSDNGGLSAPEWKKVPVTSNAPLREGKGHLYEGGIRVPLIVAGPGVRAGRVEATPVQSVDFLPTILDFASAKVPPGVDGVSITGLLRSGTPPPERDLYWHYPHYSNQIGRPSSAIRRGTWKLIEFHEDHHSELYDLSEDMGEQKDLAAAFPERANELKARLHGWQKKVNAQFPTPNPNYDPKREEESYWWISGVLPGK
ncbi:MAG: sulfatase [Bryobacteraceae bacterium]